MKSNKKLFWRIFWLAAILLVWQAVTYFGLCHPLLVPAPARVAAELADSFISGELLSQVMVSTGFIAAGMFISIILAIFACALSLSGDMLNGLTDTLSMLCHPLPAVAIIPLVIIWFGVGTWAMLFIIVHSVVWPMFLNISAGIKSVPEMYKESAKSMNLSGLRLFFDIYIPSSAPHLISGLQIGWARAWRALISAEMIFGAISGGGGIGFYILKSRTLMNTPRLYAGVIIIIIIGLLVEEFFTAAENLTVKKWGMTRL